MHRRAWSGLLWVLVGVAVATACGDGAGQGTMDAADTAADATVRMDAGGADAAPDARPADAGGDVAGPDAHPDGAAADARDAVGPDGAPPDAVADAAPDAAGPDAGDDAAAPACEPPLPPLALSLWLAVEGAEQIPDGAPWERNAEAFVRQHGPALIGRAGDWRALELEFVADGAVLTAFYELPHGHRVPVALGERLQVETRIRLWFEGADAALRLSDLDGTLRAALYDGTWDDEYAETPCPPYEGECGLVQDGVVALALDGDRAAGPSVRLAQGESGGVETAAGRYRVLLGRVYRNLTQECADYPDSFIRWAILGNLRESQCFCADGYDCVRGAACETEVHRCVPDLCAGDPCEAGEWCSPYGGCLEPPAGVLFPCETTADCRGRPGSALVCNTYLGYCQGDWCADVDCDAAFCSPLLGRCYDCRHDCDCPGSTCDPAAERCDAGPCDPDKLRLTRDNPERYDYYVVCIPQNGVDPAIELQAIDPTIQCTGLHPVCWDVSEQSCIGQLEFEFPSTRIPAAKWAQLCALTQLAWVRLVAGGHLLD